MAKWIENIPVQKLWMEDAIGNSFTNNNNNKIAETTISLTSSIISLTVNCKIKNNNNITNGKS